VVEWRVYVLVGVCSTVEISCATGWSAGVSLSVVLKSVKTGE
jgi:hypothetical protein